MKYIKLLLVAVFVTLNSCAIMFNGSRQEVTVKSMTPNSKIYVDGDYEGDDLVTVNLKRKNNHTVIVKKEGCTKETRLIEAHTQVGWIAFDALFNWLAFATDAPTRSMERF